MTEAIGPVCRDVELENSIVTLILLRLHGKPDVSDFLAKNVGWYGNIDELFKPIETDFHKRAESELFEKPQVVLEVQLDVVDVVLERVIPLDAATESKARVLFRIIIDESVELRIHHPCAHHLDPSGVF